ncbi:MAG: hypothetical protein ACI4OI_04405, partial [Gemmiger sp.]
MNKTKDTTRPLPGLGVQGQLMLFISGVTLFTLALIWALITYWLEPQYNRTIRTSLEGKAAAITALIDAADAPISRRVFGTLVLNEDFWEQMRRAVEDGVLNV